MEKILQQIIKSDWRRSLGDEPARVVLCTEKVSWL